MADYVNVQISTDTLYNIFADRIKFWYKVFNGSELSVLKCKLFMRMYKRYVDDGVFEGSKLDVKFIVDKDVISNCQMFERLDLSDKSFNLLLKCWQKGDSDVSEFEFKEGGFAFIEAYDEDAEAFLIRY